MPQGKTGRQNGKTYTVFPGRNSRTNEDDQLPATGENAKGIKVIPADSDAVLSAVASRKGASTSPTFDQLKLRKKRQGIVDSLADSRG